MSHIEKANRIAQQILEGNVSQNLLEGVWTCTTNVSFCGGLNQKAKAIIYRALKRAGYVYYLALPASDEEANKWGVCLKKDLPEATHLVWTGYTLNHAAHKIGNGNARNGYQIYHFG